MHYGLCRCSFFLWFGFGGWSCSSFLASIVNEDYLAETDIHSNVEIDIAIDINTDVGVDLYVYVYICT